MGGRQADVFVQMKNFHPAPIDVGRSGQRIQEFKLRCPGGGYEAGVSLIAERPPERARGVIGCCLAKRAHRVVGTITGSELTRKWGAGGLPDDTVRILFRGSAGQSFGAFMPRG